ncbi:hypothetical protein B591_25103 [Streptomyces sp. GBA 94-10 4N24]|nr:hypothetical protein B591_25103 [Streptomyces sp. GBA 94-10 4N24]UZN62036.1 hypothetical protein B591N_25103 [Streptomyces sp. GBA 94-10 4N24]
MHSSAAAVYRPLAGRSSSRRRNAGTAGSGSGRPASSASSGTAARYEPVRGYHIGLQRRPRPRRVQPGQGHRRDAARAPTAGR